MQRRSAAFRAVFFWALAAVLLPPLALSAAADAQEGGVVQAIEDYDVETLTALAALAAEPGSADQGGQAGLAAGILAAWRNDAAAATALEAAARDAGLSALARRAAWRALGGAHLRAGRFADAAAAMAAGEELMAEDDPDIAASQAQAMRFAAALADAPRMVAEVAPSGVAPLTRDIASLVRADIEINGASQEAVLDTGAGYSTIVQSAAERLGLTFLDAEVDVGSASSSSVPARLAVADSLVLAGGRFEHVVFIVLPDSALSFADGAYVIEAIVGLPVLAELGRLEFVAGADGEELRHGPSPHQAGEGSNLILDGLAPIVFLEADGADGPLVFMLDTGANETNLPSDARADHPALLADAETASTRFGGAGGVAVDEETLVIPRLTLFVAGVPVALEDVRVAGDAPGPRARGLLGQDVLRSGSGYVIDFEAMRLELLP